MSTPTIHIAPPSWRGAYLELIGALIRQRRQQKYTQEYMAARLGKGIVTFRRWESGRTCPDAPDLFQWAAFLGVKISFLIVSEGEEVAP